MSIELAQLVHRIHMGANLPSVALGTPFVAMVTNGGHQYPAEAPALIVRFLREHSAPIPCGPPAPGERWPRTVRARSAK